MGYEFIDRGVAKRDLHALFMQRINDRQVEVQVFEDEVAVVLLLSWAINYDEIRRWLSICEKKHSRCQLEEPTTFSGLFVALSSVWGASYTSAQESNHGISGTDPTQVHLPGIIHDSVAITLQLGLRYLWVDRYRINQTVATPKHDLIVNIDSIFNNVYLTIIAAAGADSETGNPGVSYIARRIEFNGTANYI
ncbi:putative Heterokaryon incompatibility domain-containing protein [Seiridium unicorne]|uniref:Heterokaryon incompatibility domain-containing protein n=1 Tax=Seiridium unicorne TaxID=138068 RepID=A0ABR2V7U1_9PEZI